ncbi:hypothetical protein ACM39_02620 [Chryseobacterium sp. FH2]|uniref:hypothetical protein n=1 Tax=Chryseobacterium sp. FH2 TaxID=1674291 RepID=UPI00065AF097|nr:hypothetical protein [Chryseobacterium sp. FH2]KMQ69951.1 hypothetical protein ACM39_02620 [Chryseobacterium sp. FH2]
MNKFDFNQIGGFPLSTNILDGIQTAYSLFNALGEIAGNFAIISGCNVNGSTVSDGTVYINGEILEFRGGLLGANVIILQEPESRVFESGENKVILQKRYVTFGSSVTSYPWADFKRVFPTIQIQSFKDNFEARLAALENKPSPIPIGMIAIWNKPSTVAIPTGWQECTDLRGRVPVGWDPSDNIDFGVIGKADGEKRVILTQPQLPNARLKTFRNVTVDGWGSNYGPYPAVRVGSGGYENYFITGTWQEPDVYQTSPLGNGESHNNLQPYRVIRFIEYIG